MTETEKLLLNALEQLQKTHSATVRALNSRMDKLEAVCAELSKNQALQADILRDLQGDREALERLSQDLAQSLSALRRS